MNEEFIKKKHDLFTNENSDNIEKYESLKDEWSYNIDVTKTNIIMIHR